MATFDRVSPAGGKLLADRALSRLLQKDWLKTLEELGRVRGAGQR